MQSFFLFWYYFIHALALISSFIYRSFSVVSRNESWFSNRNSLDVTFHFIPFSLLDNISPALWCNCKHSYMYICIHSWLKDKAMWFLHHFIFIADWHQAFVLDKFCDVVHRPERKGQKNSLYSGDMVVISLNSLQMTNFIYPPPTTNPFFY